MDVTRIVFDCPVSPVLVGIGVLAVLAALVVVVRRDTAGLAGVRRRAIVGVVGAATVMLAGIVLSPKLIHTWPDPQRARCVVLVDGSRSMLLSDGYTGPSADWLRTRETANPKRAGTTVPGPAKDAAKRRWRRDAVVRAVLADAPGTWLSQMRARFDVSGYRFARELAGLALGDGAPPFSVDEDGYATALGEALSASAESGGVRRPAGVILISDGASNTGRDPSEAARVLGRSGTPVFVVGVGDPDPPRDVAVAGLRGPKNALLGDELLLTAQVTTTGLGAQRVTVELTCQGEPCAGKPIVTRPTGRPVNVTFSYVPKGPGPHLFAARVAGVEGEENTANNAATTVVEVAERRIEVLLVEDEPRWEFRFLRNVLERDPAVSVTVCLLRPGLRPVAGPGYLTAPPTDKKDLQRYDLVVLGDVDASQLPEAFLRGLAERVKRQGAALAVLAGRRSRYRRLHGSPLGPILPVALDGTGGTERGGAPFRAELTPDGAEHLLTRLAAAGQENELCWAGLPRVRWSAGVNGLRRGAQALVVHPFRLAGASKLPLVAVQNVMSGKVLWVGMEETWRWRRSAGDRYHYRFWAQAVRWLVKKRFADGDPHARLAIDRTTCSVGERVEVEAYCLGPDGFPLEDARVHLLVTHTAQPPARLAMAPAPGGWGIYRARFVPDRAGRHRLQPIVSVYGRKPLGSSVHLDVERVDLEKYVLAQDRSRLESIAQASGGRYLEPMEADRLPSLLADVVGKRLLTAEYSPCRHWVYYVVLSLVLAAGWFVRKRSGLA